MPITVDDMVRREVQVCLSSLVHTLALAYNTVEPCRFANGVSEHGREAQALFEQAFELASPILDYDEAATQAGWNNPDPVMGWTNDAYETTCYDTAQELCEAENIEPYEWEVFEHWAVSGWLAEKLEAAGEKVDKDFAGMCVWARTTTGQGIASDGVIQRIHAEMVRP